MSIRGMQYLRANDKSLENKPPDRGAWLDLMSCVPLEGILRLDLDPPADNRCISGSGTDITAPDSRPVVEE